MEVAAFAPAKVNLYLHVTGRRSDGYHLIDSLVAFADIGDRVTARTAAELSLEVTGPEAADLADDGDDNLVLRAARILAERARTGSAGAALRLEKRLPVASGLGGGSSDAAAALRALCELWRVTLDEAALADIAAALGADVRVCLHAHTAWVGGIGEQIEPAPDLPDAGIVLANPRRKLPTPAVFAARRGDFSASVERFRPMPHAPVELAEALACRRNDLTDAAIGLVPEIGEVLTALSRLSGALLARMSGSGATCFALFGDRRAAERACAALAATEPLWWCRAGGLVAAAGVSR